MHKYYLIILFLAVALGLWPFAATAFDSPPQSPPAVTAEAPVQPSLEASSLPSSETSAVNTIEAATAEVTTALTPEVVAAPTVEAAVSASGETVTATAEVPPAEGATYKGVPWGADFNDFKAAKGFAGNLGPLSAAFAGSADDKDIAMLLDVPVSAKDANGEQRVMFEYVPRKFAAVYFEPDDTHYIFYYGKFALAFSRINSKNFELYRDTFYKKYQKSGGFSKKYDLAAKKSVLLQAAIFEKGETMAYLIKNQLIDKKAVFLSTKLLFASKQLLGAIRKEIDDKLAADKMSGSEKSKQELEKDLQKIE
jgi:hypothetical protein